MICPFIGDRFQRLPGIVAPAKAEEGLGDQNQDKETESTIYTSGRFTLSVLKQSSTSKLSFRPPNFPLMWCGIVSTII